MYGDGLQVRDWLHVSDHAAGIEFVLRHGEPGETYNLAGGTELPNREVIGAPARRRRPRLVARPDRPGPAGPRPPVRDGRVEAPRARLVARGAVRARACPRPSPGTATTRPGSRRRRAATGRPTTTRQYASRAGPGEPPRTSRRSRQADRAGRGHRRQRAPRPGADRGARGGAVHGADGPDRLVAARARPRHARRAPRSTGSSRATARGRDPRRRLDRRRRLRPRARRSPLRRNGDATGAIARACAARGVELVAVSTNEVFDGTRTDGRGYRAGRGAVARPTRTARRRPTASGRRGPRTRTADAAPRDRPDVAGSTARPATTSPRRSPRAALRARDAGEPLRVVGDEIGTPTYTRDVADAIVELLAEDALTERPARHGDPPPRQRRPGEPRRLGPRGPARDRHRRRHRGGARRRPGSGRRTPPLWAVLEPTPLPSGEPMRHWRDAFADAVPALRRALAKG